ncbi:MAG: hypothetical protein UT33_C0005G0029 [Candidatus Peregrinibacteria bacterium GW2011_GWC2_39_14]|nr:MAG: hypothetical protein US92_C0001G0029 [Candidatus Peregrinibacteria bacterium GW2011_GWA2_38_36]KKR07085.1 MAG: hypothetical protein UT33_C0005G0029 [Candidatus Peregrinibacteria bacterium GW2011_GWC2_39_14]
MKIASKTLKKSYKGSSSKSLDKGIFYKTDKNCFGINFPLGVDAKKLISKLKNQ